MVFFISVTRVTNVKNFREFSLFKKSSSVSKNSSSVDLYIFRFSLWYLPFYIFIYKCIKNTKLYQSLFHRLNYRKSLVARLELEREIQIETESARWRHCPAGEWISKLEILPRDEPFCTMGSSIHPPFIKNHNYFPNS